MIVNFECPIELNFGYDFGRSQECYELVQQDDVCAACYNCQVDLITLAKLTCVGLVNYDGPYKEKEDYYSYLKKQVISQNIENMMYKSQMVDYFGNNRHP